MPCYIPVRTTVSDTIVPRGGATGFNRGQGGGIHVIQLQKINTMFASPRRSAQTAVLFCVVGLPTGREQGRDKAE